MRHFIGIAGPIGSGKGALADHLKVRHRAVLLSANAVLKKALADKQLQVNRQNMQNVAVELTQQYGEPYLAKTAVEEIGSANEGLFVYDGMRYLGQRDYFQNLPNSRFVLISIWAPLSVRYRRVLTRDQYPDEEAFSLDDFIRIGEHPVESNIPALMQKADFSFRNEHSLEELFVQVDRLFPHMF